MGKAPLAGSAVIILGLLDGARYTVSEIAGVHGVHPRSVASTIKKLVERGFVEVDGWKHPWKGPAAARYAVTALGRDALAVRGLLAFWEPTLVGSTDAEKADYLRNVLGCSYDDVMLHLGETKEHWVYLNRRAKRGS